MAKKTTIQWCDSSNNPVMGCNGCELWPTIILLITAILDALCVAGFAVDPQWRVFLRILLEEKSASDVYHERAIIAEKTVRQMSVLDAPMRRHLEQSVAAAIAAEFKCYAGLLHVWRGVNDVKPEKHVNPGYAPKFEQVTKYPGRMLEAAQWSDLRGTSRADKPWLDGQPRLIFISDMGDLLSKEVDFEYIKTEVIDNVNSPAGQRHQWLWLTKRPGRMVDFSDWLLEQGFSWPDNLMAMTSVTSPKTVGRVDQLRRVKCKQQGLSVEPLWAAVRLPLNGIDWVIVGGESALRQQDAATFELTWARDLCEQCRAAGVAVFIKQLGSNPVENGTTLKLADHHGGDWSEWSGDLRIREVPSTFLACHSSGNDKIAEATAR